MRELETIYGELLDSFEERAGYRPDDSCDMAVRLYALAAQIQALAIQTDWALAQSFPQSAGGAYLDAHAQLRGLRRLAAARAGGRLRFSVDEPSAEARVIPAGTVCMTAEDIRFQTTETATLAAGELTAEAPAEALEPGQAGNVAVGRICLMAAMPGGIVRCDNPAAFFGGGDAEEDEALRRRVMESYQRLPNGANAAFYQQVAMSHEGVAAATVVGRARGIGTVDVCIATAAGQPSAALLEAVRADLQARREIAVDVAVKPPVAAAVTVQAQVAVAEGFEVAEVLARAAEAVRGHFTGRLLGRGLRLAELGNLLYGVEGVENYRLLEPVADFSAAATALPVLERVTILEMEA